MTERLTVGSINFAAPYEAETSSTTSGLTSEEVYAKVSKFAHFPRPEWTLITPGGGVYKHHDLMTLVVPHLALGFANQPLNYDPTQTP